MWNGDLFSPEWHELNSYILTLGSLGDPRYNMKELDFTLRKYCVLEEVVV